MLATSSVQIFMNSMSQLGKLFYLKIGDVVTSLSLHRNNPDVDVVMLTIEDGISLIRRKGE